VYETGLQLRKALPFCSKAVLYDEKAVLYGCVAVLFLHDKKAFSAKMNDRFARVK